MSNRHSDNIPISSTMKMKIFNHNTLLALNNSSIQAGRKQHLRSVKAGPGAVDRYWINEVLAIERNGQSEMRLCVVLDIFTGQTAWLDISLEEYEAIPETMLSYPEWETAMCAGTPPVPA